MTMTTSVYSIRNEWLRLADEENKLRLELIKLQEQKSKLIAFCVEQADRLSGRAMDELKPDGTLRAEFKPQTDVEAVANYVQPSRRRCGNPWCRQPGHIARYCTTPRPDKDDQARIARETGPDWPEKKKRKMKPLTEEQKQVRRNALVKARAARKAKS